MRRVELHLGADVHQVGPVSASRRRRRDLSREASQCIQIQPILEVAPRQIRDIINVLHSLPLKPLEVLVDHVRQILPARDLGYHKLVILRLHQIADFRLQVLRYRIDVLGLHFEVLLLGLQAGMIAGLYLVL